MDNYVKLIKTVTKIVKRHGIQLYVKDWKHKSITDKFVNYSQLIDYLKDIISKYHLHSFLYSKSCVRAISNKPSKTQSVSITNFMIPKQK